MAKRAHKLAGAAPHAVFRLNYKLFGHFWLSTYSNVENTPPSVLISSVRENAKTRRDTLKKIFLAGSFASMAGSAVAHAAHRPPAAYLCINLPAARSASHISYIGTITLYMAIRRKSRIFFHL
jgi:hypothetical protein